MNARRADIRGGEVVGGHYRLDHVLAEGGMGVVWVAQDLRLGRLVAVKFLGEGALSNPLQRERFTREARLASKIRSPHVVQIIGDGVTAGDVPFVVMELLDGESLASRLAREGRCSLATCGVVVEQICRALRSAHTLHLVHRDIKPGNIFLTPQEDGDLFVRLLDFGIAKELHRNPIGLTQSGEVLGTAYYMSPEQFRQPDSVTAATDIWSLGVVLYEMLTGVIPFEEKTFPNLAVRVAQGKFAPPSSIRTDLPRAVDAVVARALAVQPSQRFANVEELSAFFLRIVRANTSESVIRPDVMRALQGRKAQSASNSEQLGETHLLTTSTRISRASKSWGALLVVLCALILLVSWLILERSERALNDVDSAPHVMPSTPAPAPEIAPVVEEATIPSGIDQIPKLPEEPAPKPALRPQQTSIQAATDARSAPVTNSPRSKRKRRAPKEEAAAESREPAPPAVVKPVSPAPVAKESNYGF
jgi:serine/threonine protein kinase